MSALVTDTHALLWFINKSSRLSEAARTAMRTAEDTGSAIYVPAISIVEIRYLVEKGTFTEADYGKVIIALKDDATALALAPLNLDVAEALAQIPRATVPDMPDRIIAATALALKLPLVSKDEEIRKLTNVTILW